MGRLVRILLSAGGLLAGLFVAQSSPNFGVVQGMASLVVVAAIVLVLALTPRK